MKMSKLGSAFGVFLMGVTGAMPLKSAELLQPLAEYVGARTSEFDKIPAERQTRLGEIASFVRTRRDKGQPIKLTFVCTHNSRRSQMAQVWAAIAAAHHGVPGVEVYSGGTEGTAFNPRAVAALQRAGVKVEKQDDAGDVVNSRYEVAFASYAKPLVCFSKAYTERPNPQADFVAVMTCAEADKNCPIVVGAVARIALPYEDPKASDDTAQEATAYDERCAQIARELLFAFSGLSGGR